MGDAQHPEVPDRAAVIHDLGKLRLELRAATNMHSPNRQHMIRRRIDRRLEELYSIDDPAGIASVDEWGQAG